MSKRISDVVTSKTGKGRRKYSKNGCLECKRRKVKCDETKPECWQCTHLSKRCEYRDGTIQFRPTKVGDLKISKPRSGSARSLNNSKKFQVDKENPKKHSIPELDITDGSSYSTGVIDLNSLLNDALLLANDLFSTIPEPLNDVENILLLNQQFIGGESFSNWNFISSALSNIADLERNYLEAFYFNVSYWLMPLASSPFANTCNHILFYHILKMHILQNSTDSYLQSSMVSIGAKYVYNVTGEEKHNSIRKHFLRKALQQLYAEFEILPKEKTNSSQIESLILCVLLLTLDSSTFKSQEWKVHLRGVKDLFLKYDTAEITERDSDEIRKRTMALARSWFSAIAAIASIYKSSSFCSETEVDDMLEIGSLSGSSSLLKEMGFMAENGYNLFLGYSTEAISLLKEVMKCLDSLKYTDKYNDKFLLICSLVQLSRDFSFYPNNFGKIDLRKLQLLKIKMTETAVVHYKHNTYSIYDAIQQAHVETLFVTFLTKCINLHNSSPLVQNSCKRVWEMVQWIFHDIELTTHEIELMIDGLKKGSIKTFRDLCNLPVDLVAKCIIPSLRNDFRMMMLQSAFVVSIARIIDLDSETLSTVRCSTLAYLMLLADNLGAESAKASINYLIKKWYPHSFGFQENDCALGDDEALPFS